MICKSLSDLRCASHPHHGHYRWAESQGLLQAALQQVQILQLKNIRVENYSSQKTGHFLKCCEKVLWFLLFQIPPTFFKSNTFF